MTLNNDAKFEETLTLWFQKQHEALGAIIGALKSLENCTLMGSFRQKSPEELCVMTLMGNVKFKGKLTCGL